MQENDVRWGQLVTTSCSYLPRCWPVVRENLSTIYALANVMDEFYTPKMPLREAAERYSEMWLACTAYGAIHLRRLREFNFSSVGPGPEEYKGSGENS